MKQEFVAARLDVKAFAQAAGEVIGHDLLSKYERLMSETQGLGADVTVNWAARGELRSGLGGQEQVWLHLTADICLPLTCQRCLGPVAIPVAVDRYFRFVADEAAAEAQDEEAEEDVLALSHEFNLQDLIEDELLMALPLVPLHEVCPMAVKLAVADPDFDAPSAEKPNPFAVLAKLKSGNAS
jgi:uncharacterized protein